MKFVRKRLTYANVMSSLALFLVLAGGTAFAAAKLGKNTVGSKQLKNNAVTSAKIKKGAVTGSKIAAGAVGASAINTTGLTVPNASHANDATNATNANHATSADSANSATSAENAVNAQTAVNAQNAANAANFSRYFNFGLKKATTGQTEVPLGSIGPFSFFGECVDLGGGDIEASIYAKTNADGSEVYAYDSDYQWDMTTTDKAELGYDGTSSTSAYGNFYSYYDSWVAASPDGSTFLSGEAHPMVHLFGSACAFLMYGFNESP